MRIALEGSIQTRSWDDNEGNKRYATEVIVDHAEFCESKKDGAVPKITEHKAAAQSPSGDIDGFMPVDFEEDLPFF